MVDQNEAKLKCLRWIETMTMVGCESFTQELGEYWGWPDGDGDNDEGTNFIARWACFSGDSMGFSQEFRGRGWAGLLAAMEEGDDAEGPGYAIDWDERKGHTIDDMLSVEEW